MNAPTKAEVDAAIEDGARLCGCTALICKTCYPDVVWRDWIGEKGWAAYLKKPKYQVTT